jgi:hypothetical protein
MVVEAAGRVDPPLSPLAGRAVQRPRSRGADVDASARTAAILAGRHQPSAAASAHPDAVPAYRRASAPSPS